MSFAPSPIHHHNKWVVFQPSKIRAVPMALLYPQYPQYPQYLTWLVHWFLLPLVVDLVPWKQLSPGPDQPKEVVVDRPE